MKEKWYLQTKKADFNEIAQKFNISPITARLIRNRDVVGDEAIAEYLHSDINRLSSPWLFKDMDKAVDILRIKISQNNKMRIIGDYDCDGICSSYILLTSFQKLGADVDVVIPHRIEDGYGINENLIKKAYEDGIDTIITCDNGIAAYEQIKFAKSLGMTVVITDHHEVPYDEVDGVREYRIPEADAVINHKQPDCTYPFKELCGAMVAYQLVAALYDSFGMSVIETYPLLSYGAIATVCDIMDLVGENRTIVKFGMEQFKKNRDVGINALINACKIDKNHLSSYHFGFVIGPCLNATGRLNTAKMAIDLLTEKNPDKANQLAEKLKNLNDERKLLTEQGAEEAIKIAEDLTDMVLVIYLENCHESIAGIIAGRVKERFNKPTFVLTDAENGVKGSGRSIEEYDMYHELTKVKELFTKFGGHKMAAGISLKKENIDLLRKMLNENCNLTQEDLYLKVWIDMQLPLEYVTMNLINEMSLLEPWGKANTKPAFAEKQLHIMRLSILGKTGNVIKLIVENVTGNRMTAMIFNKSQEFMAFLKDKYGDMEINNAMEGRKNSIEFMATFYPNINEYMGNQEIQIVIDRFC